MINLYLNPSSDKLLPITSQTLQNKRVILFEKLGLYNQPIPDSFYNKSRPNFYPLQTWCGRNYQEWYQLFWTSKKIPL